MPKLGPIADAVSKKDRDKVDGIVSKYTRALLGLANEKKVPFSYVGHKKSQADEIVKTSKVNHAVVKALLGR